MKWVVAVTGALLVLAAASSATGQTRTDAGRKTQPTQNVFVTNTPADAVPTSIVGTPSVSITGTPSVSVSGTPSVSVSGTPSVNVANTPTVNVAPTQTPFQQFVSASYGGGGEGCDPIVVPAGKQLTIQFFTAEAETNAPPNVYLRIDASAGGGFNFVRPVALDLNPWNGAAKYVGSMSTTLVSGAASDPNGTTFSYQACIGDGGGTGFFRGFVSGYLTSA
jgi:hypothetical protein